MKVYITVECGKNARILNAYTDKRKAEKHAEIYAHTFGVWVNVIEKKIVK